ncbi:MAG TPA: hypothetical protein PK228_16610 [Saprospiraceae bacterium]|nr:hypothetical protein [Saprospiraceae bacterium]
MKITLSERASEQLAILLTYLELEWSPRVRDNVYLQNGTLVRGYRGIPTRFSWF